jgi:hypothetical protein
MMPAVKGMSFQRLHGLQWFCGLRPRAICKGLQVDFFFNFGREKLPAGEGREKHQPAMSRRTIAPLAGHPVHKARYTKYLGYKSYSSLITIGRQADKISIPDVDLS